MTWQVPGGRFFRCHRPCARVAACSAGRTDRSGRVRGCHALRISHSAARTRRSALEHDGDGPGRDAPRRCSVRDGCGRGVLCFGTATGSGGCGGVLRGPVAASSARTVFLQDRALVVQDAKVRVQDLPVRGAEQWLIMPDGTFRGDMDRSSLGRGP